ncbi:atherin-like [Camelus ferus]|uniref:Atherin-like n=1 Tax=Camelus ferus TaxID=419612 RepID=A0A8B8SHX4_CAMFR|nr:atherin-like [Camelus ferus]
MKKEAHRAGVPAVPRAAPTSHGTPAERPVVLTTATAQQKRRSEARSLAQKYSLDTGNGSRKSHESTALDRTLTPQNCGLPAAAQGDVSLWGHSSRSWASPPCPRRAPSQPPGPATARKRRPLPTLNPADPTRGRQGEGQSALRGGGHLRGARLPGPGQRRSPAPPGPPRRRRPIRPTGGPELPPRGAPGPPRSQTRPRAPRGLQAGQSRPEPPPTPRGGPHPRSGVARTPSLEAAPPRPQPSEPPEPLTHRRRPSCQRLLRGAAS